MSIFVVPWGIKRSMLRLLVLAQWARRFLLIVIYFLSKPSKFSLTNLGMHSFNSVCGKFVQRVLKSYVLMDVTSPLEFASETKFDTSSDF